jgi:hypothetical protein
MSWKDDYREHKNELGLTWSEYHDRQFVHVNDLDDATATLEELREHVEACTREYRDLKREFHELRVLLESEDLDP